MLAIKFKILRFWRSNLPSFLCNFSEIFSAISVFTNQQKKLKKIKKFHLKNLFSNFDYFPHYLYPVFSSYFSPLLFFFFISFSRWRHIGGRDGMFNHSLDWIQEERKRRTPTIPLRWIFLHGTFRESPSDGDRSTPWEFFPFSRQKRRKKKKKEYTKRRK